MITLISKKIIYNGITKRFMNTEEIQDQRLAPPVPLINNTNSNNTTQNNVVPEIKEEIQQDPLRNETPTVEILETMGKKLSDKLNVPSKRTEISEPDGNATMPLEISNTFQFGEQPFHTKEAALADRTLKGVSYSLQEYNRSIGKEIVFSEDLAHKWNEHIKKTDDALKDLKKERSNSWTAWRDICLKFVVCTGSVLGMLTLMYKLGAFPAFGNALGATASALASAVSASTKQATSETVTNGIASNTDPKSTITLLLESPITGSGVLMTAGVVAISIGALTTMIKLIKFLRKIK